MSTPTDDLRAWAMTRMRQRGLSHAQLALRCGVDRSTVTRFLSGDRRPTLDTAVRIMDVLYDTSCVPPEARLRGLVSGPGRVAAALRTDPLLAASHVEPLMRQYLDRRIASVGEQVGRDDRHRWAATTPGVLEAELGRAAGQQFPPLSADPR